MKKIALLTSQDPYDTRNFSGTLYFMRDALEQSVSWRVDTISYRKIERSHFTSFIDRVFKRLFHKSIFAKSLKNIEKDIQSGVYDVVIAVVCSELIDKVTVPDNVKIIFVSDATPKFLRDYYQWEIPANTHEQEERVLRKSWRVVYSSQYIADCSLKEFPNIEHFEEKVFTIPFGLNFSHPPKKSISKEVNGTINLLFIGKDWNRKGGETCLKIFKLLKNSGLRTKLTIIGSSVKEYDKDIIVYPYLNKNKEKDLNIYHETMFSAHFLLLPTLADCTPMVIAEANSYSIPALTTNVGGIPTLIEDGKNGFLFDVHDNEQKYVDKIKLLWKSEQYTKLSKNSFYVYKNKLNWNAWVKSLENLLRNSDC